MKRSYHYIPVLSLLLLCTILPYYHTNAFTLMRPLITRGSGSSSMGVSVSTATADASNAHFRKSKLSLLMSYDDDDEEDEFDEDDLFSGSSRGSFSYGSSDKKKDYDMGSGSDVNVDGNPIIEYNEYAHDFEDTLDHMLEIGEASGDFDEHIPKFNTLTLVGRLGSDPEARFFEGGNCVVNVGLAVTRTYDPIEREAKGIKYGEEETEWYSLEVWGKDAEYISNYATKGARVGVSGQFVLDAWTNRDQELRTKPTIIVDTIEILETKAESQLRRQNSSGRNYGGRQNQQSKGGSGKDNGLADMGYSTGFRVNDDDSGYPSSAGSGSFF